MKKVIEMGYADPDAHRHAGPQLGRISDVVSSLTQTDMFAAVVTGAPPTNLVSFYGETYPGNRHAAAGHHRSRPGAHGRRNAVDNHQLAQRASRPILQRAATSRRRS